jgi:Ni/Co efflux regulator RcnB
MNKKMFVPLLLAAAVASATASAQDRNYRNDRDNNYQGQRDQRDNNWQGQRDQRDNSRDWNGQVQRDGRRYVEAGYDERGYRGAGPRHDLRRGGYLPSRYRTRQYVVDNYREHRLSAPPRGYHWVQAGSDYALVAVATGLIANILLSQ